MKPIHATPYGRLDSADLYEDAPAPELKPGADPIGEIADRIHEGIYESRAKKADYDATPRSHHYRWGLECEQRGLLQAAKRETSVALRDLHLRGAKAISDRLEQDDGCARRFAEMAARCLNVSKRSVERALKGKIIPNLLRAVAGTRFDTAQWLTRLAALSLEQQHAFAREAHRRREELLLINEIFGDGRLRRLDHAMLDALEAIDRNDQQTRRKLAAMTQSEAVEAVANWQREHEAQERRATEINKLREQSRATIRTTARQTAQVAYAAMTPADKAEFLEVNGLTRARVIRGECISNAFDAVEGEA
jgi:hypothetical protein